ncbi:lysosome membrane protein 2 [Drosophila miranda]|uniref:lysosome membrane protein 2 n=1 Tax=Drosophila miranda TaxID=7229 RepID=UPI0007E6C97A|nr:lysosome membrane protein 2 [Drosophila miranda]
MKLFTNKNQRNAKLLRCAALGMTLLFFGSLILVSDPVQSILDVQLNLKPGSLLYLLWLDPPIDVYINVYMFNYTNVDAFTDGIDTKLKLDEVGPYVYKEVLTNHNITLNEANNTISYSPRREYIFVPERSVGDPKVDHIRAPNIPLMGVTTLASSLSVFASLGLSAVAKRLNAQPMLEMSVHEYMWGYEDHLVELAAKFVPSWIDFASFGIMEKLFREGNESNVVNMNLPELKDKYGVKLPGSPRGYTLDSINGERGFTRWEYDEQTNGTMCNRIWGSHDATLFPRDINEKDAFYLYRRTFCRKLPLKFNSTRTYNGIDGYEFVMEPDVFDSELGNPNSSCFCKNNRCLKKGVGSVSPCYYNIPLAITYPHFMHGDPSLLEPFEGLQPDESRFSSVFVVQPQLGAPMQGTHLRLQANQVVGKVNFNSLMEPFEDMVLPLLWVDLNIDVLSFSLRMLIHGIKWGFHLLQWTAALGMLLAGVYQLCSALMVCFWPSAHQQQFLKVEQAEKGGRPGSLTLAVATLRQSSVVASLQMAQEQEEQHLLSSGSSIKPNLPDA